MPSLILIDGGIGQLHAAAEALDKLEIINQPLASIAKKEEILYVLGRENEPIALDHHSPVLHLIQQVRDEAHRFAVTFHRQRRSGRRLRTELTGIPGIGERTAQKLLQKFGSVARLKKMSVEEIAAEISRTQAERVFEGLRGAPLRK
jgi:excinuclease ABC subunit C